jgi:hypothetical protein
VDSVERQGRDALDAILFLEYLEEMQEQYVSHRDRLEQRLLGILKSGADKSCMGLTMTQAIAWHRWSSFRACPCKRRIRSYSSRSAFTRNGHDWTRRFSLIAGALDIPGQAIIDGEVVVVEDGRTNFSELQAELAAGRQDRLVYYAFDLL